MSKIDYDEFMSRIYDYSSYFGQARFQEPDKFNGFYYEHLNNNKKRILEFGSATGMLSIPLARFGHKLDCVDISPFMQDVLTDKLKNEADVTKQNINQIIADATTFKGKDLYDAIVMTESFLIALPDLDMQLTVLRNCLRNLKKNGRIYTDLHQPLYNVIYKGTLNESTTFLDKNGTPYLMNILFRNDKYTQIQDWDILYTCLASNESNITQEIKVNMKFRYLFYSELKLMLEKSGFDVIDVDINHADGRGFAVIAEKR